MKRVMTMILTLSILGGVTLSCKTSAQTLRVKVTNIDTNKPGRIMLMVFSEQGFPKKHDQARVVQFKPADAPELLFEVPVQANPFALKILHDENEDGKTSKNWTGIVPSEGLGFSNGARLRWRGPPNFKDARLQLQSLEQPLVIDIIYP